MLGRGGHDEGVSASPHAPVRVRLGHLGHSGVGCHVLLLNNLCPTVLGSGGGVWRMRPRRSR